MSSNYDELLCLSRVQVEISPSRILNSPAIYKSRVVPPKGISCEKDGAYFKITDPKLDDELISPSNVTSLIKERLNVLRFTSKELDRLPHRLVVSVLSDREDVRLGDVRVMNDRWDSKTPDVIENGVVIEVSTSKISHERAYAVKNDDHTSYRGPSKLRGLEFCILAVGTSHVKSDLFLSDEEIDSIILAFSLGRIVQAACQSIGYHIMETDDDDTLDFLDSQFRKCADYDSMIPECGMTISKENWEAGRRAEWSDAPYKGLDELVKERVSELIVSTDSPDKSYEWSRKTVEDFNMEIRNSGRKLRDPGNRKRLPVPLCICRPSTSTEVFRIDTVHPLGQFWSSLLNENSENYDDDYTSAASALFGMKEEEEIRKEKYFSDWWKDDCRVAAEVDDWKFFTEDGLFAKSMGKEKEESLNFVPDDTWGEDFDKFFYSWNDMMKPYDGQSTHTKRLLELCELQRHKIPDLVWENLNLWLSSKLGSALSFLSTVMSEININIRKPTRSKDFYVTRLRGYNAYLAMHNTGSDKHSYYSLIVPKCDYTTEPWMECFRDWVDIGGYMATKICSTRKHDLSMLLGIQQKAFTIISSCLDVFSESSFKKATRGTHEALCSVLIALENSNETSDNMMINRFFLMRTCMSRDVSVNYSDPCKKLRKGMRSRLNAYLVKKMLLNSLVSARERQNFRRLKTDEDRADFEHIIGKGQRWADVEDDVDAEEEEISDKDLAKDKTCARSFITGEIFKNYEEALYVSYLGVYHNKDKVEQNQTYFQIFEKIVKLETKMRDTRPEYCNPGIEGEVDVSDIRPHEFSKTHMNNCGLKILSHLEERGVTEEILMRKIADAVDRVTYEELATLKSSGKYREFYSEKTDANPFRDVKFELEKVVDKGKFKSSDASRKQKALMGVLQVFEDIESGSTRPSRDLPKILQLCLDHGGIISVLFKKDQLNGVREIFILTMVARILIKTVETVARTICEECTNEYLTKGKEKKVSTPTHYRKVSQMMKPGCQPMTVSDSLDCSTWCQNFVFPAFGAVFQPLTRKWDGLSEYIRLIFNMASVKRHLLPDYLLYSYCTKPDEKSISEHMNELKSQFLAEGGDLVEEYSIFLKNLSNMMQGIFHYVSSVCHAGHLLVISDLCKATLYRTGIKNIVHTTKVSSDDASSILTVIVDSDLPEKSKTRIRLALMKCSLYLYHSYPLMCASVSAEKSTPLVMSNIEEFNSVWTYVNTVLSIQSKFSMAAISTKVSRNSEECMRTDHNLISDFIANGGSIFTSKAIEITCLANHYDCLGMHSKSEEFWNCFKSDLLETQNPKLWYYLISPPVIGVTLGYDITRHYHEERSANCRRSNFVLRNRVAGEIEDTGLGISASLIIGSNKRYKAFIRELDEFSSKEEADEYFEINWRSLYMPSSSKIESKYKIISKCHSSQVARSFCFDSSSLMHSASSYIINKPCLTVSIKDGEEWEMKKMSLAALLKFVSDKSTGEEYRHTVPDFYKSLLNLCQKYSIRQFIPVSRTRRVVVNLKFPKFKNMEEINLMTVVRQMWLGIPSGYKQETVENAMETYMTELPWLRKTNSETAAALKSMGIEELTQQRLHKLIESVSNKDRTISFLHPGSKSTTMVGTYLRCIERCQVRNKRIANSISDVGNDLSTKLMDLETDMFWRTQVPQEVRGDLPDVEALLDNFDSTLLESADDNIKGIPKRLRRVLKIVQLQKNKTNSDFCKKILLQDSESFILIFEKEQKRVGDDWVGEGRARVITSSSQFIISYDGQQLREIRHNDPDKIVNHTKILTTIFRRLGIKSIPESRIKTAGITLRGGEVRYNANLGMRVAKYNIMPPNIEVKVEIQSEMFGPIRVMVSCRLSHQNKWTKCDNTSIMPCAHGIRQRTSVASIRDLNRLIMDRREDVQEFVTKSLRDRAHRLKLGTFYDASNYMEAVVSNVVSVEDQNLLESLFDDIDSDSDDYDMVFEDDEASVDDYDVENDEDNEGLTELFEMTSKTYERSYSEFTIWDEWITKCQQIFHYSLSDLIRGNYGYPKDEKRERILKKLAELDVIKAVEEDDLDEYF